ncbi:MAG: hypothetical protein NXH90_14440 [Flavobacteriaceae bacterium]|nr:hypothetical protein [Flavobacteriaceae bacterium]
MDTIKANDKICINCKHLEWLIGIGQGLRCGHQAKREEGKMAPLVPGKFHTCDLFELKVEPKSILKESDKR